jgi:hypothetical protein
MDRVILRILSLYESLGLLELWYEIGEEGTQKERVTQEELLGRLEALHTRGLVERFPAGGGDTRWTLSGREIGQQPNGS